MKFLFNWVFPQICLYCHQIIKQGFICEDCHQVLPWPQKNCQICALEIPNFEKSFCPSCRQKPPAFHKLHTLFNYDSPIDVFIQKLKFQEKLLYGEFFVEEFKQKIPLWYKTDKLPQAILPVPLSAKRLRQRGFNQAVILAKPLAKQFKIPLLIHECERIKATKAQTLLKGKEHAENLKNAFSLKKQIHFEHIAILDDVVTTGATIDALIKALRNTSIKRIDIWCCARTQIKKNLT